MTPRRVLIVGAGLAGSRCAETLRAEGYDGEVTLVGEELDAPYERPALSKEFLAGARESLALRAEGAWADRGIRLELGCRVEWVDAALRTTSLGGSWDALVLATGARARRLPFAAPAGVHVLRTRADAEALRADLRPGSRLAVVGAGFVGTEVASTARTLGVEVALVDVTRVPLERVLGDEVGSLLAAQAAGHGVELRLGSGLAGFRARADGRVSGLDLDDGSEVRCDTVLVAVGAAPAAELAGDPRTGIATDACGRTEIPGVYACGDVVHAHRPSLGRPLRVEHWTSAAGQAAAVAHAILGRERPHDELPYFWSDQFGLRLQHVGHAEDWAAVELDGTPGEFTARYLDDDGRPLAVLLVNRPREVGVARRELAGRALEAAA